MRTKRTIAVLIMLMLMALPTFVPGVYAEEKTVTVTDAAGLQGAVNEANENIKVKLQNDISGGLLLNTKSGVTYTIEGVNSSGTYNILGAVKITGAGTVVINNVFINAANYSSYGDGIDGYSLWVIDTANVTVNANVIGGGQPDEYSFGLWSGKGNY